MTALDPFRTLGLAPGATDAEIKRAYRKLAKEHHPDRGGPSELPRFLAIQAAYEMLTAGRALGPGGRSWPGAGGSAGGGAGPARPWEADPARARATREQWRRRAGGAAGSAGTSRAGGTAGTAGSSGSASGPASGPDATSDRESAGSARGPRSGGGHGAGHGPTGSARGSSGGRHHHRRKATPGSTTYDDALHEPAEPDWLGSAWYGQASGTYWTINPREYADPRKHGPEYQERARRAARAAGRGGPTDADPVEGIGDAGRTSGGPGAGGPGVGEPPSGEGLAGRGPATTGSKTHQTHAARPRTAGSSSDFGRRSWARPAAGPAGAGDWASAARPAASTRREEPSQARGGAPEPGETRRSVDPAAGAPPEAGSGNPVREASPEGSAPDAGPPAGAGSAGSTARGLGSRLGRLFGRGPRDESSGG